MELNEIKELINAISESKVTSFTLEEGNMKISIKSGEGKQTQIVNMAPAIPAAPMMSAVAPVINTPVAQTQAPAAAEAAEENAADDKNLKTVNSPLVGTFYSAPSPDAEPFVRVGDVVKKGQVVGIVEAMKLMNEIESEQDGVITEIMVNNGDMVEYGQILIKVK